MDYPGPASSLTRFVKKCSICEITISIDNSYGTWGCQKCKEFFAECVTKNVTAFCYVNGECNLSPNYDCTFCRLNKCYDAGMKAEFVEHYSPKRWDENPEDSTRVQCLKKRFYAQSRRIVEDFTESSRYMEQSYYKWLFSLDKFNELPSASQDKLLVRTLLKGTVLEYIQRSLHVHDVIRSIRCFFRPRDCCVPLVKQFGESILDFTQLFRYVAVDEKSFFRFKIKLSMGLENECSGNNHYFTEKEQDVDPEKKIGTILHVFAEATGLTGNQFKGTFTALPCSIIIKKEKRIQKETSTLPEKYYSNRGYIF
ncbi:nuclear receptor subfamily 2 group F member 6-like [Centruroides sculpturatus]|uniref:nuclear receptor subfamily 2 group F member 6-like n=1 Tax=Centruroides sculpturatus TaxID=218467 RepID=UPI000C6E3A31|nr:nuclear receptor subfamily 2 group F member 6-like [Centruroides sculpturatus]